jgi:methylmalonyl-CoA mutase cobalamin-binding subunit
MSSVGYHRALCLREPVATLCTMAEGDTSGSAAFDFGSLLPPDLPSGIDLVREGRELGRAVDRAPSLFLEQKQMRSEREWREQAREQGTLCTTVNIGLATWADTRQALETIYEDALSRGVRPPDHFTLLAERRMGLPKHLRASAPHETGPMLWSEQDWWELTHTVPMQPGAEDNIIGGPGSLENALSALAVGVTHVGVLSQYFWRWPYWDDDVAQTAAVVSAAGALAAWRDEGVCLTSYLDDGFPGVFHDYANLVGWGMLEHHIVSNLIGCAYARTWGGLTHDPIVKSAVTLALFQTDPERVPPAFINGDTIGNTSDIEANAAVASTDLLFMKLVDARYRIGSAPVAVPLTETQRIPSLSEIAMVHAMNRRLEEYLSSVTAAIDWAVIEAKAADLIEGGTRFFRAALEGLRLGNVDVNDPLQMLLVLKLLGAERAEELFGAGRPDPSFPRGREPVMHTDLIKDTLARRDSIVDSLRRGGAASLEGRRVVLASTDVHEMASFILDSALTEAGAQVTNCGISCDPEDIVKVMVETDAESVVVTTHNGVARSFATTLRTAMAEEQLTDRPLFMGGVLNEDIEGSPTPVDVRDQLERLGVLTPLGVEDLISEMATQLSARQSIDAAT